MGSTQTHPEHIVDEEAAKEDAAGADVVEMQEFHPIEGEGQSKEVVGNPVLGKTAVRPSFAPAPVRSHLGPGPLLTFLSRYQMPTMLLRPRHTRSLVSNS